MFSIQMDQLDTLTKLFGSQSRVKILQFFLDNPNQKFRVNQVIKKAKVNARLVSSELKKLAMIGILFSNPSGNALLYQVDETSPLVKPLKEILATVSLMLTWSSTTTT